MHTNGFPGAPERVDLLATAGGPDHIYALALGFWQAKVVLSAVELGVFTELAKQPMDARELATRLHLPGRGTRDFFDALVALRLLDREDGVYRNTPITAVHLDRAKPGTYLGELLEFANDTWYRNWGNLTAALRTGLQQNGLGEHGTIPLGMVYSDPERVRKFHRAVAAGSLAAIPDIAERLPWARFRTVLDVGCSSGTLLSALLQRWPQLHGVGYDLPAIGTFFADTVKETGLADRMRFVAGSFFTGPLPHADVVVLGHLLHAWELETQRMLLRKAYQAMPPGGMVLIQEPLIDDERRENTFGLLLSLHLLLQSPGGSGGTGTDYLGRLGEAGFRDCRIERLSGPESLVVGFR